jgi:hypothetical protein
LCFVAFLFNIKKPITPINPAKSIKRFSAGVHNPSWAPTRVPAIPGTAKKPHTAVKALPRQTHHHQSFPS